MIIYFDGSSSPHSHTGAGWGVVVEHGDKEVAFWGALPPATTNNEAEFCALIEALKVAKGRKAKIYGDSKLVVDMFNDECKGKKRELVALKEYAQSLSEYPITWVSRDNNKADKWAKLRGKSA